MTFERLVPGADGCEPDDVAEQHGDGGEHLARVESVFSSSGKKVFAHKNRFLVK
jgi:hypothetical protein